MDNHNYSLNDVPGDLYPQIFSSFSPRDFLIFSQLNKKYEELVLKNGDVFWKGFCIADKHASWSGVKLEDITKHSSLSWQDVYKLSEPCFYISKMRKLDIQELKIGNNPNGSKPLDWKLPSNCLKKWTHKNKIIEQSNLQLSCTANIEKMIVTLFGKKRFNQIPLLKDEFLDRSVPFTNKIRELIAIYIIDSTFSAIVRGETSDGKKFLFMRSQHFKRKHNEYIGNYFNFCYSLGNSFIDHNEMHSFDLNGSDCEGKVFPQIKRSTIGVLQSLLKTGSYDLSKKNKIQLDFDWK